MTAPARIIANAMHRAARQHAEQRRPARATVTSLSPLALDLHGADLTLDKDDIEFAKAVDPDTLAVDDIVVVIELGEGDWMVVAAV